MFKHVDGPFKSNGTSDIHVRTFHLFVHLMCCSFEPLLITTRSDILKLPTTKHYILNLGMKFQVL
jgi:hypothetical protein